MSEPTKAQDVVNAVVRRQQSNVSALRSVLDKSLAELQKALPSGRLPEQFVRVLMTTCQRSPKLLECTRESIVMAAFESAALGLPLDGVLGHAYLVPFNNRRKVGGQWSSVLEAQMMIGYRGYCELAYRSGKIARISASVVYERDHFDYSDGTTPFLTHQVPMTGDRGEKIGAYAVAHTNIAGTPPLFRVLRRDEIEQRRAKSKTAGRDDSPWKTDEDAMWRKTAIRALAPFLPQSPEMQRAASAEEMREVNRPQGRTIIALPEQDMALIEAAKKYDASEPTGEVTPDEQAQMDALEF